MELQVEEINGLGELASVDADWHDLWLRTEDASFFHSPEWFQAAHSHDPLECGLRILLVRGQDNLIGILPLVLRSEPRRLGTFRVLTYPLNDWGPYYGPIGPQPKETLRAGLEYLQNRKRDWDLLDLRWTPPEDRDPADTLSTLESLGMNFRTRLRHHTSIVDLTDTWDAFVKQRSKNWRSHYRRRHKRAAQAGEIQHVRYRPRGAEFGESDPRFDLYDTCVALAEKSWQGSSETGNTLCHSSVRDLLRSVHVQAAHLGCLDMNLVYLNGEPISFAYNYHHRGHVFALRLGYDPEFANLGPGNLVEELAIQDSFARGDRIYELGPGAEDSKRSLRTRLEPIWQHTHYPTLAVRSQLVRLKALATDWSQSFGSPSTDR